MSEEYEDKKSYYAIIPANVRYDKRLNPNTKLLYGEITSLCNEKGYCWATNKYFAELYSVEPQTISTWIRKLKELNYIDVEMIYKEGSKEILNRYMKLNEYPINEILNTPIKKNLKENNKNINNKFNKKEIYKEKDNKHQYGTYKNVLLSDTELETLKQEFPDYQDRIERVSEYCASKGKSYKNYLATIRAWARKEKPTPSSTPTYDATNNQKMSEQEEQELLNLMKVGNK